MLDLPPRLHVAEAQLLSEMAKEVKQSKRRQEICHLLVPQILKTADVRIQVPHDDSVPPQ